MANQEGHLMKSNSRHEPTHSSPKGIGWPRSAVRRFFFWRATQMTDAEFQQHYETNIRPALFPSEKRQPAERPRVHDTADGREPCGGGYRKMLTAGVASQ